MDKVKNFFSNIKLPQGDWAKAVLWIGVAWSVAYTVTNLEPNVVGFLGLFSFCGFVAYMCMRD